MTEQLTLDSLADTAPVAKVRDGWTHGDMIFVEQGKGYGLDAECRTVNLGDMVAVERYLQHGISAGLNTRQIEVLEIVKKVEDLVGRESESVKPIRANTKRSELAKGAEHKQSHTGRVAPEQKLSVYPSKHKG